MNTISTWTTDRIKQLETEIAERQAELQYWKGFAFMEDLEKTARTFLAPCLSAHYGEVAKKCFEVGDLTCKHNYTGEYFNFTNIIKRAISTHKSRAAIKSEPMWGAEAKRIAKMMDAYDEAQKTK